MILSTRYKVVVDTNVIISGAVFGGNSGKILQLITNDKLQLIISSEILKEILHKVKEFKVKSTDIKSLEKILSLYTIWVDPRKKPNICRDPKDNMFLAVAYEGKADFIVTGDKDLLILKKFDKTLIITPREFLNILGKINPS